MAKAPINLEGAGKPATTSTLEDIARQVSATPKTTAKSSITPVSSVPVTPVNQNLPTGPATLAQPTGSTGSTKATGSTGAAVSTGPTGAIVPQAAVPPAPTNNANAAQMLTALFMSYGLTGDIATGVAAMKQGGLDDLTIEALMKSPDPASALKVMNLNPSQISAAQKTIDSWNTRFSGNVMRQKAGLPPLDPATYIAQEDTYKQLAARAGLPAAVMSTDYLGKIMAANVDPYTFNERINAANAVLDNEDPYITAQLEQSMGINRGLQLLHIVDPNTAAPLINQQVNAAKVGAEAARAGVNINQQYAMQLAGQNISQNQAQQGFQSIAAQLPGTQEIATRFGAYAPAGEVGGVLQTAMFGTPGGMTQAQAQAELERLKAQEANIFSGSSAAGKGSLLGSEEGVS
jgi:hypothetical protein